MYRRDIYINKILPYINKPFIKVITGMRRVGKSYFLLQLIDLLKERKIPEENILYINMESLDYEFIRNYKNLNDYVMEKMSLSKGGDKYLFIDEIQEIQGWEKTVTSLFNKEEFDIYITGSNAHLLSSEIATLLSGRYVEIPIYSLSFSEYLQFRDEKREEPERELLNYIRYGGFPVIHYLDFSDEIIFQYINSLYNTILLKDVVKKNSIRNINLLENLARFIFDNIGNIFSARSIAKYLKSQKLRVGIETIQNYISYISSTFILYKVPRYDIKGKRLLDIYEKYYLGDIGIRHAILGYREADISGILENIVYLELRRRDYKVSLGKFGDKEIDFIAEKSNKKIYIQVSYLLSSKETIDREFSVLKSIKDNYRKYVISMDTAFGNDSDGIKRIHLLEFLLSSEI